MAKGNYDHGRDPDDQPIPPKHLGGNYFYCTDSKGNSYYLNGRQITHMQEVREEGIEVTKVYVAGASTPLEIQGHVAMSIGTLAAAYDKGLA